MHALLAVTYWCCTYKLMSDPGTEVPQEPHRPHLVADSDASELFQGV